MGPRTESHLKISPEIGLHAGFVPPFSIPGALQPARAYPVELTSVGNK